MFLRYTNFPIRIQIHEKRVLFDFNEKRQKYGGIVIYFLADGWSIDYFPSKPPLRNNIISGQQNPPRILCIGMDLLNLRTP